MKTNQKLQELVQNQIENAIQTVQDSKSKSKTKETKEVKLKTKTQEKSEKKTKAVKSAKEQQGAALLENVISQREVKYIYPDGIEDTLSRKKWRQQVRNKLHQLEREMNRITDRNSKEFNEAKKKFEAYQKQVLKPNQVA